MAICMLEALGTVESTNDEVRRRIEGGAVHGSAVWAEAQRRGRGRHGREWFSPEAQNLYLSVAIVRPECARFVGWIPLAVGLGAARAVEALTSVSPWLKWPNDLYLGNEKLGGVLCEGVARDGRLAAVGAGVGINVGTRADEVPERLCGVMTSLAMHEAEVPVQSLAERARVEIVSAVDTLLDGGVDAIRSAWLERDRLIGEKVLVSEHGGEFEAVAIGLGDDGALRIRLEDGAVRAVVAGDVSLRTS